MSASAITGARRTKQRRSAGTGGGSNLAKDLQTPFLGGIPIDPRIRIGGDNGVPIVYDDLETEHAKAITQIAKNLADQVNIRNLGAESSSKVEIILGDDD
ncbi:MAG: P-loop NTPase [Gammaproteobacteria bacterium]